MRRLILPVIALALMLTAAGCNKSSVEGKWSGSTTVQNTPVSITLELNKGGAFSLSQSVQTPMMKLESTQAGTWVKKESNLEFTVTEVSTLGRKQKLPRPEVRNQPFKLEKDTLTISPGGGLGDVVLTRVKESR